jgi:hypothetical protein
VFYAIVSFVFAAALLAVPLRWGGWAWLALWPTISLISVGSGYAWLGARVIGKCPSGRLPLWSLLLNGPYLFYYNLVWRLIRRLRPGNTFDRVAPGLLLGQRPRRGELPPGVIWVVDLAAEMRRSPGLVDDEHYRSYPALDGDMMELPEFTDAAHAVAALPGDVLIHCAAGHGRSATLAAAVLLLRGQAQSPEEARHMLCAARPGVRMNRRHLRILAGFAAAEASRTARPHGTA